MSREEAMADLRNPKEFSHQDATFLFLNSLQEHLAKSDFANGIKARETPKIVKTGTNGKTETIIPLRKKDVDKDPQLAARITRLKPPRDGK